MSTESIRVSGRIVGLLFLVAVAGLVLLVVLEADGWSQRQLLTWGAAFFYVFGAGFVLARFHAGDSWVLRALVQHVRHRRYGIPLWGPGRPVAKAGVCFGLGTLLLLMGLFGT